MAKWLLRREWPPFTFAIRIDNSHLLRSRVRHVGGASHLFRSSSSAPVRSLLMAQGEILEHQGTLGPARAEEPGEDDVDHGSIIPGDRAEVQW
jgi:hypothetical protein